MHCLKQSVQNTYTTKGQNIRFCCTFPALFLVQYQCLNVDLLCGTALYPWCIKLCNKYKNGNCGSTWRLASLLSESLPAIIRVTPATLLLHCSEKGPYFGDFFDLFGPYWVPIYTSGSLFSVFWLKSWKECQFSLHVHNNE